MLTDFMGIWKEAAREAWGSLARSPLVLVMFWLIGPVFTIGASFLFRFPGIGGFLVGLLEAFLVGWYLALVEIAVTGRRRVDFQDLQEHAGSYLGEVLSVMFPFFLVSLLLQPSPMLLALFVPLASLAFNPAPESVWMDHRQGFEVFRESVAFMKENWPEWLLPHVLLYGVFAAMTWLLFGGSPSLDDLIEVFATFGPFFGFVFRGGWYAALHEDLFVFVQMILWSTVTHAFVLFRGHLYAKLRRSNRRSRAWANRASGRG